LIGYLSVGSWRVGHEQFEEPLPVRGQTGHGVANDLITLVGQNALVDLGPGGYDIGEDVVAVAQDHPLADRQAAQALVPRGGHEPGAHPIGVLDPVDVLEQAQPCGLGDVGGVALSQLEFPVIAQMSLAN
jgi:hypothetical protein